MSEPLILLAAIPLGFLVAYLIDRHENHDDHDDFRPPDDWGLQ